MSLSRSPKQKPFDRAILVLEDVISTSESPTISGIAARLSLPMTTVHRLVRQLEDRGLLRRQLNSSRLLPGTRLVNLGVGVLGAGLRADQTRTILRELAAELGEHCQIGIVVDGEVLYVETARASIDRVDGLNIEFQPGRRAPLHCTSIGKLYLASLSEQDLKGLIASGRLRAFTVNTIVDQTKLLRALRKIRRDGWAWNDQEYVLGVVGCAVPIHNAKDELIAALGMSAPAARMGAKELPRLVPRLRKAAAMIADLLM
jgi:DNA-binding IclR family transcriptional regulator